VKIPIGWPSGLGWDRSGNAFHTLIDGLTLTRLTARARVLLQAFAFTPGVQRALRVDISVTLFMTASTALTVPFTGLILRRDLGATPFQLSILASANAACLLLSLGLVRLVDGRRPLKCVVWTGFFARALLLLPLFIHTPWPFVGVLVAGTLLGTVQSPALTALVEQLYPRPERGRALGVVRMVGALLAIGLAVAAGRMLDWVSWRWVFAAAGLAGMIACLRQRQLPVPDAGHDSGPPDRPSFTDAWRTIRDDRAYRRVLVGSFVFGSGIWLQMPATPLVLADVVHATKSQVGLLSAVAAVAALGGNLLWGRLVDGRSSLRALQVVYLIGVLTPLVYFFARTPWMLMGASITESLMATGLDLVWMLVVIDFAGRRSTAQYAAIASTLGGIRGVVGPLVGAALIEWAGIHVVFLIAAVLMAAGAWLVTRQVGDAVRVPKRALVPALR
jgi:MFS family permease